MALTLMSCLGSGWMRTFDIWTVNAKESVVVHVVDSHTVEWSELIDTYCRYLQGSCI